jgi:hypothetical protein
MLRLNLLRNPRNAALRYHQAKTLVKRFRFAPGRHAGKISPNRLRVPFFQDRLVGGRRLNVVTGWDVFPRKRSDLVRLAHLEHRIKGLADAVRPGKGLYPSTIFAFHSRSRPLQRLGARGKRMFGGLGAFKGLGRGWKKTWRIRTQGLRWTEVGRPTRAK